MVEGEAIVVPEEGLHARPAAEALAELISKG